MTEDTVIAKLKKRVEEKAFKKILDDHLTDAMHRQLAIICRQVVKANVSTIEKRVKAHVKKLLPKMVAQLTKEIADNLRIYVTD